MIGIGNRRVHTPIERWDLSNGLQLVRYPIGTAIRGREFGTEEREDDDVHFAFFVDGNTNSRGAFQEDEETTSLLKKFWETEVPFRED